MLASHATPATVEREIKKYLEQDSKIKLKHFYSDFSKQPYIINFSTTDKFKSPKYDAYEIALHNDLKYPGKKFLVNILKIKTKKIK